MEKYVELSDQEDEERTLTLTYVTSLSMFYVLRKRRRRRRRENSLVFWVTLLSGCFASGYTVLSTVPVTFRAVAHFHMSICKKNRKKKIDALSWTMVL